MISKHSHEQSEQGEGVHVVKNEPCEDPKFGKGQFTEKRVYLSRYELWQIWCICNVEFEVFFLLGFIPRFHCKLFCECVHLYMYMEDGMCYIRLLLYCGYFPCEVTSNWECNFRSEDWVLHLCQFIEVIPMHYLVTNNLLREAWEQRAIILISWTSW